MCSAEDGTLTCVCLANSRALQDTVCKVLELLQSDKDVRKGTWTNKEVRLAFFSRALFLCPCFTTDE